jgi:hypothetical protein
MPQKNMQTANTSGNHRACEKLNNMLKSNAPIKLPAMNQGLTGSNKASRRSMIMALSLCLWLRRLKWLKWLDEVDWGVC